MQSRWRGGRSARDKPSVSSHARQNFLRHADLAVYASQPGVTSPLDMHWIENPGPGWKTLWAFGSSKFPVTRAAACAM